jgi:hypothetical protein
MMDEMPRDFEILADETGSCEPHESAALSLKKENLQLKIQLYQTQGMLLQYQNKELEALFKEATDELNKLE